MSFDIDIVLNRGAAPIAARFATPPGLVALFAPSGAGKTTTLDMIAGLTRPTSGRIAVAGQVLFDSAAGINLPPQARGCGYVFQDIRLFPHLNVRGNLLYGSKLASAQRRGAILGMALDETCAFLGIGHLLNRRPATLSGGEAQRVAIGRTLLAGPRFLLMDEPLSSLDADRREEIIPVIARLRDELALPILYVSHDRAEVERLASQIVPLVEAY